MPALRIVLGAVLPQYFGSNFNSTGGASGRSGRNERSLSPKAESDPEADPINKTIATWTAGPADRSRTPSPVEMNNFAQHERKPQDEDKHWKVESQAMFVVSASFYVRMLVGKRKSSLQYATEYFLIILTSQVGAVPFVSIFLCYNPNEKEKAPYQIFNLSFFNVLLFFLRFEYNVYLGSLFDQVTHINHTAGT